MQTPNDSCFWDAGHTIDGLVEITPERRLLQGGRPRRCADGHIQIKYQLSEHVLAAFAWMGGMPVAPVV